MLLAGLLALSINDPTSEDWRRAALNDLRLSDWGRQHLARRAGDNANLINQLPHTLRAMLTLRELVADASLDDAVLARCEEAMRLSDSVHGGRIGWSMTRYSPNMILNSNFEAFSPSGVVIWQEQFESRPSQRVRLRSGPLQLKKKSEGRGKSLWFQPPQGLEIDLEQSAYESILSLDVLTSSMQNGIVLDDLQGRRIVPILPGSARREAWGSMSWRLPAGPSRKLLISPFNQEPAKLWLDNIRLVKADTDSLDAWSASAALEPGQSTVQKLNHIPALRGQSFRLQVDYSGPGQVRAFVKGLDGTIQSNEVAPGESPGWAVALPAASLQLEAIGGPIRLRQVSLKQSASLDAFALLAEIAHVGCVLQGGYPDRSQRLLQFVKRSLETRSGDLFMEDGKGGYTYPLDASEEFPGASLPLNLQADAMLAHHFVGKGLKDAASQATATKISVALQSSFQSWGWPYQFELFESRRSGVKALARSPDDDSHGEKVARAIWQMRQDKAGFRLEDEALARRSLSGLRQGDGWAKRMDGKEVSLERRPLIGVWLRFATPDQASLLNLAFAKWLGVPSNEGWSILQKAEMARLLKGNVRQ